MITLRRGMIALALLSISACGGSTISTGQPSGVLSVGGSYPTTVSLSQSTCPGITVANGTTTVAHAAGAATLTISHAGNDYSGTVTTAGAFTTQAKTVSGGGEAHTLTITGQFSANGFTAQVAVTVARQTAPASCSYDVAWTGTKTGSANSFP